MLPAWLVYDPTSPSGVRFACNYNKAKAGDVAGTRTRNYWYVSVNGKRFAAHRLVWEHFNGTIPDGMEVDHKEGWANSIGNLRVATVGRTSAIQRRSTTTRRASRVCLLVSVASTAALCITV